MYVGRGGGGAVIFDAFIDVLFVCRISAERGPATPGEHSVLAADWEPRLSLIP